LTGYAHNHPASAGSLLAEWTSMARSERLTSTRDTLLASSRRQRFDLALGKALRRQRPAAAQIFASLVFDLSYFYAIVADSTRAFSTSSPNQDIRF
jgi:hypothetical protein